MTLFRMRRIQSGLRIASAVLAAACTLVAAALLRPVQRWSPPAIAPAPAQAKDVDRSSAGGLDLSVIWRRNLRQPLFDAPAPAIAEAPLAVKLVGTILDPQQTLALFEVPGKGVIVRPAGSLVEGFAVVAIERGRALLRRNARDYDLRVPWFERIERETRGGHGQ